ncbi:SRPBCC domain-containing protein [Dermacoccaceae bacterium W4C1]
MSDNLIQVFSVYIEAPATSVWKAITTSEYTTKWGYGGETELEPKAGGVYRNLTTPEMREMGLGDVAVSGEVLEIDEPYKLVVTWKPEWHPEVEPTTLTWELTEYPSGLTRVLLTHDVSAAPALAAEIAGGGDPDQGGGGWSWCLSGLKTLLESGREMGVAAAS